MKKILSLIIATILTIAITTSLVGCQTASGEGYSYLSVAINPSADMVLDSNGNVEEVIPTNADAEVLLAGEIDNFTGLSAEQAIEKFTELAIESGYIDPEATDNEVNIEVISDIDDKVEQISKNIVDKVNALFKNKGIFGKTNIENLDKYLAQAEQLQLDVKNISIAKIKAIITALDQNPELDITELEQMTVGQIIKLIGNKAKENCKPELKATFKAEACELRNAVAPELENLRNRIHELEILIAEAEANQDTTTVEQFKTELKIVQEQFKTAKDSYKQALNNLKDSYKEQTDKKINELKEKQQQRKQQAERALEKIKEVTDKVKEEIEKMQKGK